MDHSFGEGQLREPVGPFKNHPPQRPLATSTAMALDPVDTASTSLPSPPESDESPSPTESVICDGTETPLSSLDENDQEEDDDDDLLLPGLHVLNTEAAALNHLAHVYATNKIAQHGLRESARTIADTRSRGGKVIVIGVGKSGHIGTKLTRTLQSLAIPSVFLHPTEALHGDMGIITHNDALLFITYSGRTPELLSLLPHLDPDLPTILLTSHLTRETCAFLSERHAVLLPAPVREEEKEVTAFGVAAPMTSTTVALAVGDALAMAAARRVHGGEEGVKRVFERNHPGGAIGMKNK
ncbi:SIS domain-containing protein [Sarocladium implicatum]|nr:SIS domain-containing protein [Sarocladium implicatum]